MKSFLFLFSFLFSLQLSAQPGSVHQASKNGILKGAKSFATQDGGFITVTKDLKTVPFSITAIKYAAAGAAEWKTTVTNGTSNWQQDFPFIVQVKDGSYVIALLETLTIDIIKLNPHGAYLWDKKYRRGDPNSLTAPNIANISGIIPDNDDSAVVIVGRYSTFSKLEGYIFKLNIVTGKPAWFKTAYSNVQVANFSNQQDYFSAIDKTSDGHYLVGDVATILGKNGVVYKQYFALYKYDKNGNVVLAKAVAPNAPTGFSSTVVYDIKETEKGSYVLIGANNFGYNAYLKFNDTGKVIYTKRLHISPGDTTQFNLSRIAFNKSNGLTYISGNDPNIISKVKLFAITKTGALNSAGSFAFDSTDFKHNESLLMLANNTAVATGYSQANEDDVTNKLYYISITAKGQNCLLKKDSRYSITDVPVVQEKIQEVHTDETAKLHITASSYDVIAAGFTDAAICGGEQLLTAAATEKAASIAMPEKTSNRLSLRLLSNPVQGASAAVQVRTPAAGRFTVSVMDMNGRVLYSHQQYFSSGISSFTVPVQQFAKGMYVLTVVNLSEKCSIKFIKE